MNHEVADKEVEVGAETLHGHIRQVEPQGNILGPSAALLPSSNPQARTSQKKMGR